MKRLIASLALGGSLLGGIADSPDADGPVGVHGRELGGARKSGPGLPANNGTFAVTPACTIFVTPNGVVLSHLRHTPSRRERTGSVGASSHDAP